MEVAKVYGVGLGDFAYSHIKIAFGVIPITPYPHLLGLPLPVRRQIYKETGVLWDDSRIYLTENPSGLYDQYTRNLLLTYKTIYADVSSIVYSTSQIVLQYQKSHGLQPLRNLLPTYITCLSDVIIILNASSCPDGGCCRMKCSVNDGCRHDKPLQISSRPGEKIVSRN